MSKHLVIVESPAKAKTIEKYLGPDFQVMASYGHVRDLVPKEGRGGPGTRLPHELPGHRPQRAPRRQHRQGAQEGGSAAARHGPGPRGRGHLLAPLRTARDRGVLNGKDVQRVVFHEITQRAVKEAIEHPRGLSIRPDQRPAGTPRAGLPGGFQPLAAAVEEDQARTVRRTCAEPGPAHDRGARGGDRALRAREYWTLEAALDKKGQPFSAKLHTLDGTSSTSSTSPTRRPPTRHAARCSRPPAGACSPCACGEKAARATPPRPSPPPRCSRRRCASSGSRPAAPCAWRSSSTRASTSVPAHRPDHLHAYRLGHAGRRGARRDPRLHRRALRADKLPEHPRHYKTKAKNAQEAHEAIRPTSVMRLPDEVKRHLSTISSGSTT
jgi:DNA topoisomerase I